MIVVDEIHSCKSPSSQQGKNLLKVNKAKHLIGATGTLLLNNPVDAYHDYAQAILYLLHAWSGYCFEFQPFVQFKSFAVFKSFEVA